MKFGRVEEAGLESIKGRKLQKSQTLRVVVMVHGHIRMKVGFAVRKRDGDKSVANIVREELANSGARGERERNKLANKGIPVENDCSYKSLPY